jgi:hypothetical protein
MSQTLTYGFKKPEAGDLASVWMQALSDNVTRQDGHSHNGTDSTLLTPAAITKYSSTVSSGSWSGSAGSYTQTVTVPAGITELNNYDVMVYVTSTGERLFPGITRASATTYTISVNDNTLNLTVKYL